MPTDTSEFTQAAIELKTAIGECVGRSLKTFRERTGGITPSEIRIDLMETTTHNDRIRQYMLGDVRSSSVCDDC